MSDEVKMIIEIIEKEAGTALADTYSESDDVISRKSLLENLAKAGFKN